MQLAFIRLPAFELYAYLDNLSRGAGLDKEPGFRALRLGRLVIEAERR